MYVYPRGETRGETETKASSVRKDGRGLIVFRWTSMGVAVVPAIITAYLLKRNWYDRLEET
jgi:hypothetical protein